MWPLRTVGVLYLLSGLWCTLAYSLAANYVGYVLTEPTGAVEFLSVYGGIQLGLASAVLYFSFKPDQLRVASIFTLFISSGLLLYRLVGIGIFGSDPALVSMALVEILIVGLLVFQLFRL